MLAQMLPGFITAHSPISKYPLIEGIQKLEKVGIFYFKAESLTLSITAYFMTKNKTETKSMYSQLIVRAKTTCHDMI